MTQTIALFNNHTQRKHNEDRIRRAKTWLKRSSRKRTTIVERFIFLWISFNAAYGNEESLKNFAEEIEKKGNKKKNRADSFVFKRFLQNIISHGKKSLNQIFEAELRDSIESFLENPCLSKEFWKLAREEDVRELEGWKEEFQNENKCLMEAWENKDLRKFLPQIFIRLYELRNQIFHGGTTYPYGAGRRQIVHGTAVISFLVPIIIEIMESEIQKNSETDVWGRVTYPRIASEFLSLYGISNHILEASHNNDYG